METALRLRRCPPESACAQERGERVFVLAPSCADDEGLLDRSVRAEVAAAQAEHEREIWQNAAYRPMPIACGAPWWVGVLRR